jgi:hypothetical protein
VSAASSTQPGSRASRSAAHALPSSRYATTASRSAAATLPIARSCSTAERRDHALADELLGALGQLEQLDPCRDARLRPAERLRCAILGQPALEHRAHRLRLLVGVELLARD